MPPLPSPGQVVLIRSRTAALRNQARQELRAVLREALAAWSDIGIGQLPLVETPRGPAWNGHLAGDALDFNFSYNRNEGWIGLIRGGAIGIDAMTVSPVRDWEAVARLYLGPSALANIESAPDPVLQFAREWTILEAGLKCRKLGLTEWDEQSAESAAGLDVRSLTLEGGTIVTVATKRDVP